jgi:ketosteroid isomerase-like protein
MGMNRNKAKIRRFLSQEVFFGEGSLAVVDEVFAPDVVWRSPGSGEVIFSGTDEIKSELRRYRRMGGEIDILEQIAEEESVATRYRLELSGSNRRRFVGVTLCRFADGKIQEYRVVVADDDLITIMGKGHN